MRWLAAIVTVVPLTLLNFLIWFEEVPINLIHGPWFDLGILCLVVFGVASIAPPDHGYRLWAFIAGLLHLTVMWAYVIRGALVPVTGFLVCQAVFSVAGFWVAGWWIYKSRST